MKIFKCSHCGNIITVLHDSQVPVSCCGEPMKELVPGTTDGAAEKHIPAVEVHDRTVIAKVGEVTHPMLPEHYIEFIVLETANGVQIKYLKPGEEPKAVFELAEGEKAVAVYEYCNLHGYWKATL